MGETSESLSAGAAGLREYLRNENPYHDPLPEREKHYEREYTERRQKPEVEHERGGRRKVGEDAADRADDKQLPAPQPVD